MHMALILLWMQPPSIWLPPSLSFLHTPGRSGTAPGPPEVTPSCTALPVLGSVQGPSSACKALARTVCVAIACQMRWSFRTASSCVFALRQVLVDTVGRLEESMRFRRWQAGASARGPRSSRVRLVTPGRLDACWAIQSTAAAGRIHGLWSCIASLSLLLSVYSYLCAQYLSAQGSLPGTPRCSADILAAVGL